MAIEIVDLPIETGDFHSYVSLPEGSSGHSTTQDIFGLSESMDWEVAPVFGGRLWPPLWPPLLSTQPGHAKELFFNKGVQGFGGAVRSL